MIKKIGIKNFRVFKEYTEFEIRPITILTGPNSSGKSSLIKLINLIQNSFCNSNHLNLLNYEGGKHYLGTYKNTLNWETNSNNIKIVIDFPLNEFDEEFQLEMIFKEKNENGIIESLKIYNNKRVLFKLNNIAKHFHSTLKGINKYVIKYNLSFDLGYLKYTSNKNSHDFSREQTAAYNVYRDKWYMDNNIKNKKEKEEVTKKTFAKIGIQHIDYPLNGEEWFKREFKSLYLEKLNQNILLYDYRNINKESDLILASKLEDFYYINRDEEETIITSKNDDNLLSQILDQDPGQIIDKTLVGYNNYLKNNPNSNENINKSVKYHNVYGSDISLENLLFDNIKKRTSVFFSYFENIDYISANRGSNDRVISKTASPVIDKIIKDFSQLNIGDTEHRDHFEFLKQSLELLDIEGDLKIERVEGSASIVSVKQKDKNISIADLGFGYSQIIPIILKIILINENKHFPYNDNYYYRESVFKSKLIKKYENSLHPIFIIEEPEANLHPKLQSKLSEIFILAYNKFGMHFIIESHSEYLIRKLQYLTAKKEIGKDKSIIYYFNDNKYVSEKEPKVKPIEITETGGLTDTFGPGFFDETTRLHFDLLKLNKSKKG